LTPVASAPLGKIPTSLANIRLAWKTCQD